MEEEGHLKEAFNIQFLKTETRVLATFTSEHIKMVMAFKPKLSDQRSAGIAA
jgi:hypothetical protein